MRRWLVVASGAHIAELLPWLDGLHGVEAVCRERLAAEDLAECDGAWIHDLATEPGGLRGFADAGGRILLTQAAVHVGTRLGAEMPEPGEWTGAAAGGHAALAHHPLFEGLLRGVVTATRAGGWSLPGGSIPGIRVVARQWSGEELQPATATAWEWDVGAGGVLCIGGNASIRESAPAVRAALLALLRNALVGQGVPHADRDEATSSWPSTGDAARVETGAVAPIPELGPAPELATAITAGRRLWITGGDEGPGDAWAIPFRLVRGARADEGTRQGGLFVPLELPLLTWRLDPAAGGAVRASWEVDLALPEPLPPGAVGNLHVTLDPGGTRVRVECEGAPHLAVFSVSPGARLAASPVPGRAAVALECTSAAPVQVVAVGAVDQADLDRTWRALGRRGIAGLVSQRNQHRDQLRRFHALTTPDAGADEHLQRARALLDAHLASAPGVGRSLVDRLPGPRGVANRSLPRFATLDACRVASAQLAAGDHGGPRDLLKFLHGTLSPVGEVIADCGMTGLPSYRGGAATAAFLRLAGEYVAWTGDLEALRRAWPAVRHAHAWLLLTRPGEARLAVAGLESAADALGFLDLAEEFTPHGLAAGATGAAGVIEPVPPWDSSTSDPDTPGGAIRVIEALIRGMWGIVPDALSASVQVAPRLPAGWTSSGLERLRIGRAVVSLRLRRRTGRTTLFLERVHGPLLHVRCRLPDVRVQGLTVDDVPLGAAEARFEVTGRHAITFDHE